MIEQAEESVSGVYAIWCGKKVYIGQSGNIERRWQQHMSDLRKHKHIVSELQLYYVEHGASSIRFEVIEVVDPENLLDAERKWGTRYNDKLLNQRPFRPDAVRAYCSKLHEPFRIGNKEWLSWISACGYTMADARRELGLPNGTFYRRIAKEPTIVDRLAMRALYEGLEPFSMEVVA